MSKSHVTHFIRDSFLRSIWKNRTKKDLNNFMHWVSAGKPWDRKDRKGRKVTKPITAMEHDRLLVGYSVVLFRCITLQMRNRRLTQSNEGHSRSRVRTLIKTVMNMKKQFTWPLDEEYYNHLYPWLASNSCSVLAAIEEMLSCQMRPLHEPVLTTAASLGKAFL